MTAQRKEHIVSVFWRKHFPRWVRVKMPNQDYGKGVFVLKNPESNKVLWIEVFSLYARNSKVLMWSGWNERTYRYLGSKRYSIHLCFMFSDSGMFSILPSDLVSKWFRNDPDLGQNKWYVEIAPKQSGLNLLVFGEHKIDNMTRNDMFMNFELVGLDYPEADPSRDELYSLLLQSCHEGSRDEPNILPPA